MTVFKLQDSSVSSRVSSPSSKTQNFEIWLYTHKITACHIINLVQGVCQIREIREKSGKSQGILIEPQKIREKSKKLRKVREKSGKFKKKSGNFLLDTRQMFLEKFWAKDFQLIPQMTILKGFRDHNFKIFLGQQPWYCLSKLLTVG